MKIKVNDENVDLSVLEVGKEYIMNLGENNSNINDRICIDKINIENKEIEYHEVINKPITNTKFEQSGEIEMFDSNDKKICTSKTFTMD